VITVPLGKPASSGDADGRQQFGPGDFMTAAPRHDAWIIGDEPCHVIDWQGFADYAKRA
jgi:hypothetical protein